MSRWQESDRPISWCATSMLWDLPVTVSWLWLPHLPRPEPGPQGSLSRSPQRKTSLQPNQKKASFSCAWWRQRWQVLTGENPFTWALKLLKCFSSASENQKYAFSGPERNYLISSVSTFVVVVEFHSVLFQWDYLAPLGNTGQGDFCSWLDSDESWVWKELWSGLGSLKCKVATPGSKCSTCQRPGNSPRPTAVRLNRDASAAIYSRALVLWLSLSLGCVENVSLPESMPLAACS